MNHNPVISLATPADADAITRLVNSAYRGDSARSGWTHEADLLGGQRIDREGILETMETSGSFFLKYEENDQITGSVCLQQKENKVYLGMLTVAPHLQGKGIGKKLLKAGEAKALEQGCTVVEMTVISTRHELIEWYQRHGYINTGETKPFPSGEPRFGIPKTALEFIVLNKHLC